MAKLYWILGIAGWLWAVAFFAWLWGREHRRRGESQRRGYDVLTPHDQ